MRFIDSNIFAYAFYKNRHTERCQEVARQGGVTDALVLVEAFHIIEKIVNRKTAIHAIRAILRSNIQVTPVDMNIVFESLIRAHKYKLSVYDLVHYLVARQNECTTIVSYDSDFNNLELKREEP